MFLLFTLASCIGKEIPTKITSHQICSVLVREIQKQLKFTDKIDVIQQRFTKFCKLHHNNQEGLCNTIIQEKLNETIEMIKSDKPFDYICDSLGFKREDFQPENVIPISQCEEIADKIKSESQFDGNVNMTSLREKRTNVCKEYPEYPMPCRSIFRFVSAQLRNPEFLNQTSNEVCHQLEKKHTIRLE
ncbi:hypothetical protein GPJ56_003225 [Histomonas meleagridis]|uniref:uncharacterized protein n=1 Tax=Histomonas meleagridis TaxID=135588 RepID=UPI0035599D54|nr:hypothetical protein GPJ56_003225 [Histomonas meleagridis]KAH0803142.1 hypothetical protein GO595_004055 [Histomonas meleagridis]